MAKKHVEVALDWREDAGLTRAVDSHPEVEDYVIDELEVGDILIRDPETDEVVLFERKTPSDFAASMTDEDDHLRDQVERLAMATDGPPRVLVEGDMADFTSLTHTRVDPRSLRGFVASLEERDGARIMFTSDMAGLIDYAIRAARKQFEDDSATLRVRSATKKDAPFVKRVYGAIEGVGPEMADRMYDTFPHLQAALAAEQDDWTAIEGIGEVRAERIMAHLGGREHEVTT